MSKEGNMGIATARNGEVEIAYETIGPPTGEPLLLVMGTGGDMNAWPDDFCAALVDRRFAVARFDNRDTGLSTHFTASGTPSQLRMLLRPASAAVYRLDDMADDALAVLDALGWDAAHVVGVSQGGMIAQKMTVRHPARVRTLTSVSSAPAPRIGQPKPRTLLSVLRLGNPRRVKSREDAGQWAVDISRIAGSPGYPADEAWVRERARRSYDRSGFDPVAVQRHTAAIVASGDRRAELARVAVPTLVLHGEADRMVRLVGGRETAAAIPGARLVTYPGMGHDLPRQLWLAIIDEICTLAAMTGSTGEDTASEARMTEKW